MLSLARGKEHVHLTVPLYHSSLVPAIGYPFSLVPKSSVPALAVSMLAAYQAALDLCCISALDSALVPEFTGAIASTASPSVVPLPSYGCIAELQGLSAPQLALFGPEMVELRRTLAPSTLVHPLELLLLWRQIPSSSLIVPLASVPAPFPVLGGRVSHLVLPVPSPHSSSAPVPSLYWASDESVCLSHWGWRPIVTREPLGFLKIRVGVIFPFVIRWAPEISIRSLWY